MIWEEPVIVVYNTLLIDAFYYDDNRQFSISLFKYIKFKIYNISKNSMLNFLQKDA